ncbi:dinG family ATP-dependent helicase YoaA [Methylophaga lonarensis MPL]|uniref:DNA 5'-3' helicase n=1 Tax=Methylophaga lonarensis MPL TaxID=1286106 RepID=M7PNV9_9GAMM|nr:ATP-dependent DNA helicase [Methylophaga lonarensis]EMR12154.1 dinG family ATP-dependent helicase YoaA [Methylophaga lonarensis MPL]
MEHTVSDAISELFDKNGALARHIEGYQPRQAQQEMAQRVAQTLEQQSLLIAEAGTGTGKTFAYLAPAILSGQKVFISTGTKNLQEQLYNKDLPVLREVMSVPFRASILKGRSNYLCHHRLAMTEHDPAWLSYSALLHEIRNWQDQTRSGDLSETDFLDQQSPLWPRITSTVDNCLGQQCPEYSQCFIAEARRQAQEADIVVINHHLLMSDFALKSSGQGEVLPEADAYIIDEAHQLPAIASQFLGHRISSHQIMELCRDTVREMTVEAADMNSLQQHCDKVQARLEQLIFNIGSQENRVPWLTIYANNAVAEALETLLSAIESLLDELQLAAERGKGLNQCALRAEELLHRLEQFLPESADNNMILWLDIRTSGFILHATPHEVSEPFQQWLETKPTAWVFTSATLSVAGNFNHFARQLGIADADTASWDSPFDYATQSLLYLPNVPVEPQHPDYTQHITEIAKQVIAISQGRTFLLFTSYRAMHQVAQELEASDYPVLVQGNRSKTALLEEFREHGNAVLLGTNSFWEGVDVKGEALSCVLIDKIPFASPGDPVLEARINYLKERGGNPFRSIQIPSAVIQLKQGIGRLIRDQQDYGLLVLCDPRLLNKPYGKLFLRSLPAMPITQDIDRVEQFFSEIAQIQSA